MKHTPKAGRNIALLLGLAAGLAVAACGQTNEPSGGTVNIALANENGIVLLTDSVQSHKETDGWHHQQPVQKLFRLDDKTVCSIAGFATSEKWNDPQLRFRYVDVRGIIAEFRDQLSQHPVQELDAKTGALGFLVGTYIDLVANRYEITVGPPDSPDSFKFEMIVAGFDRGGKLRFKKLVLTPMITQAADGHRFWSHKTWTEEASTELNMYRLLAGVDEVSLQILHSPQEFGTSAVIQKYAQARKEDGGKSLTLKDLAALASEMAKQTSQRPPYVDFVGGADQIAILSEGKILKFDQPDFDDPSPRPLKISLLVNLKVQGAGAAI